MMRRLVYSTAFLAIACLQFFLLFQTSTYDIPFLGVLALDDSPSSSQNAVHTDTLSEPLLNNDSTIHTIDTSPYAYAFVIGGCDPNKPAYRNYIYDILIAADILRQRGSRADVVAFFQMSYHSNYTKLPDYDTRLLKAMKVRILYIPVSRDESFYRCMLDKFRTLSLTQYRRVLFLDGDVIPLVNLDYLFKLSDELSDKPTVLKENMVLAGTQEPSNGGFFMLTPNADALKQINVIIQDREERARSSTNSFDPVQGWGHVIDSTADKWVTNGRKAGTNWTFWAAFADQGLLYHYTKYVRKSVSIVLADRVENWGADANGTVRLEETLRPAFSNYTQPYYLTTHKCGRWTRGKGCSPPYSDFYHFTGRDKPWLQGPPVDLSNETQNATAEHLWWYTLTLLNDRLDMGITEQLHNWTTGHHQRPLLGMHPSRWQATSARTNLEETI